MKRYIFPLLLVLILLSSCSLFGKDENLENAKDAAITAIIEAREDAVKFAELKINDAVLETIQGANQDLAVSIDSAKADIKKSVDITIEERLPGFNKELADARRLSVIVGFFALSAVIFCVVLFVNVRSFENKLRDTVVGIVAGSDDITASTRINDFIEGKINKSVAKSAFRNEEVDRAVHNCLYSVKSRDYILSLITKYSSSQKEMTSVLINDCGNDRDCNNIQVNSTIKEEPKTEKVHEHNIELFARDSDSKTLSGVQSSFQQGKSIYKLILANKDDSIAEITLVDQEDARRRILRSGDDILSHVCKVDRKSSEPQVVTVVSSGKAEKQSQDVWVVVSPITVELS